MNNELTTTTTTTTVQADLADSLHTIKSQFLESKPLVYSGAVQHQTTPPSSTPNDGKIQLFFKTLTNRTRVLRANPSATILELKQQFFDIEGVPVDAQRLIYGGKELEDERTLTDYNIQQESTIFPVLRLRGGSSSALEDDLERYLKEAAPVEIITRRMGRGKVTSIVGLESDLDLDKISKHLKTLINSSACVKRMCFRCEADLARNEKACTKHKNRECKMTKARPKKGDEFSEEKPEVATEEDWREVIQTSGSNAKAVAEFLVAEEIVSRQRIHVRGEG